MAILRSRQHRSKHYSALRERLKREGAAELAKLTPAQRLRAALDLSDFCLLLAAKVREADAQQSLTARGRRPGKNEKYMPDSRIDFSDIPESTDAELKRARRVGRPRTGQAKQLIAIRISPRLLAQIRRRAANLSKPYQTLIHEMLEKAAARAF